MPMMLRETCELFSVSYKHKSPLARTSVHAYSHYTNPGLQRLHLIEVTGHMATALRVQVGDEARTSSSIRYPSPVVETYGCCLLQFGGTCTSFRPSWVRV